MRLFKHFIAIVIAISVANGANAASRVEQLQAAYLVNFFKFVRWPKSSGTLTICFLRRAQVYDLLQLGIASEQRWARIEGRTLGVRLLLDPASSDGCHMLYLDARTAEIFWNKVTPRDAMLTVSDLPDFVRLGGMIQLDTDGSDVNFAINKTRVNKSGLVISAALGTLAVRMENARIGAGGT